MKVSVGKPDKNKLSFVLEGTSTEFANAVRRYGMMGVPVFAIDSVVFYENTTSIFDEYISHRLGQIPLLTTVKALKNSEVTFVIDEVGPKVVCSSDMKCSDKDVKVAKEKIPIITLTEGQKLRLEAKAVPGNGRTHAKFQAGLLSYGILDSKFDFKVESFFQMDPEDLVVRACDVILEDLDEMKKEVKKAAK